MGNCRSASTLDTSNMLEDDKRQESVKRSPFFTVKQLPFDESSNNASNGTHSQHNESQNFEDLKIVLYEVRNS